MAPNPIRGEHEARRDGTWILVYKIPLMILFLYVVLTGYCSFLIYCNPDPYTSRCNNSSVEEEEEEMYI